MKRFFQLLALLVLSFTATSCGDSEEPDLEEAGVYTATFSGKHKTDGEEWYVASVESQQPPFTKIIENSTTLMFFDVKDYSGIQLEPGDRFLFRLKSYQQDPEIPFYYLMTDSYNIFQCEIEIIKKL